jgi:hypothetical protein
MTNTQTTPRKRGRPPKVSQEQETALGHIPAGHRMVVSVFAKHKLELRPPEIVWVGSVQQARDRGWMLTFDDHKALCPDEWVPALQEHPEFKSHAVGFLGDPLVRYKGVSQVQTQRGSVTAGTKHQKPPLADWDTMPDDELQERIVMGGFSETEALAWEASHRKRPTVMVTLAQRTADAQAQKDDPDDEQGAEFPMMSDDVELPDRIDINDEVTA